MSDSNDPFADPPSTRGSLTPGGGVPKVHSADPLDNDPTVGVTPSSPQQSDKRSTFSNNSTNRGSLQVDHMHHRTLSADPTMVDSPAGSRSSLPAALLSPGGGGADHRRSLSSDPMALDASTNGGGSASDFGGGSSKGGDSPTAPDGDHPAAKKKGWTFFKTKEEKELTQMEADENEARKLVAKEHEQAFKEEVRAEWQKSKEHFAAVEKEFKPKREAIEAEHHKCYSVFKKERKTEILEIDAQRVLEYKALKKQLKAAAKEREAAESEAAILRAKGLSPSPPPTEDASTEEAAATNGTAEEGNSDAPAS